MPCSQQHPIGFIVLREVMRNVGIGYIPVQRLHTLVNHPLVYCVLSTAYFFAVFTSIDFEAVKIGRPCTALYGKADFCTLLYAGFAYQLLIQQSIFHLAANCFTKNTGKIVFCG